MSLEEHFDAVFAARLALREKQIQQNYRPNIGIHKWFARRPGTLFRNLLLAEFAAEEPLSTAYWRPHKLSGTLADPFMGGGTPVFEATRLGFGTVAADVNPMAYWIVRQTLARLDIRAFAASTTQVISQVESLIGRFYRTYCTDCSSLAPVKYFIWVKTETCPACRANVDLFPGYLLAEAVRHPANIVVCSRCGRLNEYKTRPTFSSPAKCRECQGQVYIDGPAQNQFVTCPRCKNRFRFLNGRTRVNPPSHRMWAIEYHCAKCRGIHQGRFFKKPDSFDLSLFSEASDLLLRAPKLPIPADEIPCGDETDRLHRWGYRFYRDMFNSRQLLGLGILLRTIQRETENEIRHAMLTVFSDCLRYQNLLCRYDTYALKCQDIFSVHGFPVGLVQCEDSLLGIPRVGSGSFRHFVEKYIRAKKYCQKPFETRQDKRLVFLPSEGLQAEFVDSSSRVGNHRAMVSAAPADEIRLEPSSLDGVFTDPPYFANVQYAELIDFCYVWLRQALCGEFAAFRSRTTRNDQELTGNETLGRDLPHFTEGLSRIFRHYAAALKPGAPFVFTYHHNDPEAYIPVIVAVLDAGLDCSTTLPAAAEMSASIHIFGTGSSVLDTVFVCRHQAYKTQGVDLEALLAKDVGMMRSASVRVTRGDVRCLLAGHLVRLVINELRSTWNEAAPVPRKMAAARDAVKSIRARHSELTLARLLSLGTSNGKAEKATLAATV